MTALASALWRFLLLAVALCVVGGLCIAACEAAAFAWALASGLAERAA